MAKKTQRNPWFWIPSLYFAEGLPYVIVISLAGIMYKGMGISNTEITFYTAWLGLPWVLKPFWSPIVDIFKTKRFWIIVMQFFIAVAFAGVAFTIPTTKFFQYTLAFFWLMAFSSATHDIAADGFYMLGLTKHEQAFNIGIRNTFYRIAMLSGESLFTILAGKLELISSLNKWAWTITFIIIALLYISFLIWHFFILPRPASDIKQKIKSVKQVLEDFAETFISYFKKDGIIVSLIFILIFRFGEAQLVKISPLFFMDEVSVGGLGLSTFDVGIVKGPGIIALTIGGIIGGIVVARNGLKKWMLPMVFAMNLPNLVYVFLSFVQPQDLWVITSSVVVEQFGYGFGFTAFMLYLIILSDGKHKTAHYALCTGFMALGMMLPGMISGWIQEMVGYKYFFIWVMICTIPGFIIINFLKYDPKFGTKEKK